MIQELIKPIVKVGNSAGVILPKNWINGKARIKLIEKPLNIKKDILEILEPYLQEIEGVYLIGSYARGEQTKESDVDVLVITNKINKKIKKGKYELILIPKEKVELALEKNIIPILPMLKEAKPFVNGSLIEKYKKTQLTGKNLKWHIELTKSALNVNKEIIKLDEETNSDSSDGIAYSLILRLRGTYIVDCLIKNKTPRKKELINLIKKISGSLKSYEGYLRIKNNDPKGISSGVKDKNELPIEEAKKLYSYVLKKIKEQEKWAKTKS
ncbi:MAG: nucleotidyltransferase domain-containing protein [Nanoarchaeota archaeon]